MICLLTLITFELLKAIFFYKLRTLPKQKLYKSDLGNGRKLELGPNCQTVDIFWALLVLI